MSAEIKRVKHKHDCEQSFTTNRANPEYRTIWALADITSVISTQHLILWITLGKLYLLPSANDILDTDGRAGICSGYACVNRKFFRGKTLGFSA